jgi:polar amino acid transport system substrate-binding protein
MTRRTPLALAAAALMVLTAVACSSSDETAESATGTSCADALTTAGTLTVATGEPVFEPWMVDDDPSNGQGYEGALVYAVAEQLDIPADKVTWVRTGFDEAIAPGAKDYDFNIQQYSITDERKQVVSFSNGYYAVEQAVVAAADGPLAGASTVADLKDARLGAAVGSTSLDYIEQVIEPTNVPLVFDDNVAAKAAFDAGQVDGLVFDLPTAYYITAVEIPEASIVGVLPLEGTSDELGMLFTKDSPLVPCVNEALATLEADGTLAALEQEWLNQDGDIPTISD